MLRALVADTETTGAAAEDRICEVAWFEIDEHLSILNTVHSLIDPEMHISATASGIHGITDDMVAEAPTMAQFMDSLGAYFSEGDEVLLIAHNAEFDRRHLKAYLPIIDILCTLRLARRTWPNAENHKLPTLMYLLNLARGKSHSAHGDVHTCYDLLTKIVAESGKSLQELYNDAAAPIRVEKMPFGKHRDQSTSDLPSSYISWLLGKDNIDKDLRWTLEQVNAERYRAVFGGGR
jgi:DNA polymerase III epsilon subunit-like protein